MILVSPINWWAVLVVTAINIVIGSLWYSPVLFMKPWLRSLGISDKEMARRKAAPDCNKKMMQSMAGMAVTAIIQVIATALVFSAVGATTAGDGIIVGLILWFGIVATTTLSPILFEERPIGAYGIYLGYELVWFLVAGVILGGWH